MATRRYASAVSSAIRGHVKRSRTSGRRSRSRRVSSVNARPSAALIEAGSEESNRASSSVHQLHERGVPAHDRRRAAGEGLDNGSPNPSYSEGKTNSDEGLIEQDQLVVRNVAREHEPIGDSQCVGLLAERAVRVIDGETSNDDEGIALAEILRTARHKPSSRPEVFFRWSMPPVKSTYSPSSDGQSSRRPARAASGLVGGLKSSDTPPPVTAIFSGRRARSRVASRAVACETLSTRRMPGQLEPRPIGSAHTLSGMFSFGKTAGMRSWSVTTSGLERRRRGQTRASGEGSSGDGTW